MSSSARAGITSATNGTPAERSYFERQREALVNDIAFNMEQVLQNMNKLNRSLEGVIAVGNEFSQVEGLWSQFENVMARPEDASKDETAEPIESEAKPGHEAS